MIKKSSLSILLLLVGCLWAPMSDAKTFIGVTMQDDIEVPPAMIGATSGPTKLRLNGIGLRKKEIVLGISVNVYVAGLYVLEPTHDASVLLNLKNPKKMHILFTHSVDKDSFKNAWKESFEKNCPKSPSCDLQQPLLKELEEVMSDVDDKDTLDYIFFDQKIQIFVKGKLKGEISLAGHSVGADFEKTMLKAWIGEPPNPELKSGLLSLESK